MSYKQPGAVTAARPARLSPAGSTGRGVQKALEAANPASGGLLSLGGSLSPDVSKPELKGLAACPFCATQFERGLTQAGRPPLLRKGYR